MSSSRDDLKRILYSALSEPIGLVLAVVGEPAKARLRLYAARNACGDPALARLQIRISPFAEGELVIVKGEQTAAQAAPLGLPPASVQQSPVNSEDLGL